MKYQDEFYTTLDVRTATAGEAIAFDRAAVKFSAEDVIVKCTAATDAAIGLTVDSYDNATQAQYIQRGKLRFVSGGVITLGDPLTIDNGTAGRVRTAVGGEKVVGRAITAATGAGVYAIGEFDFVSNVVL